MPLWLYSLPAAPPWSYFLRFGVLCWLPRYLPFAFISEARIPTSQSEGCRRLGIVARHSDLPRFAGICPLWQGIGRYGARQLSDVVVGSDGTLSSITALQAMVGAVAHPWAGLDIYAYAGIERANQNVFNSAAGLIGFGVPTLKNAGCLVTTAARVVLPTARCDQGGGPFDCRFLANCSTNS
jgi:hypothetical protein